VLTITEASPSLTMDAKMECTVFFNDSGIDD
jgi:hypothetical protein